MVIRNAFEPMHQDGMGAKLKAAAALLPSLGMVRRSLPLKSLLKIAGRFFKS